MKVSKYTVLIAILLLCVTSVFAESKGNLAKAIADSEIRSENNAKAHIYANLTKDTQVIVVETKNGWFGIVMQDGRTGWVPSSALEVIKNPKTTADIQLREARDLTSTSFEEYKAGSWVNVAITKDDWVGILNEDDRLGWVESKYIEYVMVEVTFNVRGGKTPASRGGGTAVFNSRTDIGSIAQRYLDIPYIFGGTNPEKGIDCSAFVLLVYGELGLKLPRTAAEQSYVGQAVTRYEDLQPGDRLYFTNSKRVRISHTGLYLGNGIFIHASSSAGKVVTDYLFQDKWIKILVGARR